MRVIQFLTAAALTAGLTGTIASPLAGQVQPTSKRTYPVPHVLEVNRKAIAEPAPKGLSAADAKAYAAHTAWLVTVVDRIEAAAIEHGVLAPREAGSGMATGKRQHRPVEFSMQLDVLKRTFEAEGRRFSGLTNASKARHDIAMNAIRNMKA